ncbi:TPA: nitronate monooxygenase [Candidatus Bipolaricaulota bacterium]|nr:nitronate monooxygenase [Candidatus Bipolaricaulota bacterium]
MSAEGLPPLRIGDLTAPLPIVQGGMGVGISLSGLASAVAREGGIGVIATAGIGMFEPDFATNFPEANIRALRREIRRARGLTAGPLGVNIMVALTNFEDMVRVSIEEGVDVIFSGAGLPLNLPRLRPPGCHTKLVPIVSSGRAAAIVCKRWSDRYGCLPDAFVVEGPQAGGHLGFRPDQLADPAYALERLVPQVIEAVRPFAARFGREIPVIAAGGIYSGADIHRFLKLGAAGVQMATRFVATHECDAAAGFKQAYIEARPEDIVIINSPVGLPGRAIRNEFLAAVERGERKPFTCPYHCIRTCDFRRSPYCIAMALTNAQRGNLEEGFAFAGANAWRVREIVSVPDLIRSLVEEYREAAGRPSP